MDLTITKDEIIKMKFGLIFFSLFIYAAVLLGGASLACADIDVWHPANQVTVSWDAVTTTIDDKPISIGSVEYEISAAGIDRSFPETIWRGTDTMTTITIPGEGRFLLGIKAYRVVDGQDVSESDVSWSDDPQVVKDGKSFGIIYFMALPKIAGFGKE